MSISLANGEKPQGKEVDVPINYTEYYFIEVHMKQGAE
jgi:hypothetical protein